MTEPAYLSSTRSSYDAVAETYANLARTELAAKPWARAFLGVFAQLVHAGGSGPVVEVGCGTGMVTSHLSSIGLDIRGIDLSPGMLAVARRQNPGLQFDEGTMTDLDLPSDHFGGLVAWYTVMHVPPADRPGVFASFYQALAPGGYLVMAFQVRDEVRHYDAAWGHENLSIDFHPASLDSMASMLSDAGLPVQARFQRLPEEEEAAPQAHLIARKPLLR